MSDNDFDFDEFDRPAGGENAYHDDEPHHDVKLPSGALFHGCLTHDEADYILERGRRYLEDNHFVNVADLQDVDRMLVYEMLIMRWGEWIGRGFTYDGMPVEDKDLRKSVNDFSRELRGLKEALGVNKVTRDKDKGQDSIAEYITTLRRRAQEFGVKRNEEQAKVLELFNRLKALITLHDNCDDTERRELNCTIEDVLAWIRDVAIPEYDAIDEHFRQRPDGQKYWRGTL